MINLVGICIVIGIIVLLGALYLFLRRRRLLKQSHRELTEDNFRAHSGLGDLPLVRPISSNDSNGSRDSFHSCFGDIEDFEREVGHLQSRRSVSFKAVDLAGLRPKQPAKPKVKSQNKNKVSHYQWLQSLLDPIAQSSAAGTAKTMDTQQTASPLFVVAGACPNAFSPLQAVLYCEFKEAAKKSDRIDFWFVKPSASNKAKFEENTLHRHATGAFKNTAEKSKKVYAPIGDKFVGTRDGDFYFGTADGRAFMEEDGSARMLVYFIWMESWAGPMARKKFVQGKICYQKSKDGVVAPGFFARQYRIEDNTIWIAPASDEEVLPRSMPPDNFQDMFEMKT